ncbi:MAG TPA: hypothetical protein VFX76_05500 [Roseiflexaceae bacterium]|nr:hypothetical protein [Roseiflexaceae bacterium]
MQIEQFNWEQHANPRMRIRTDGRYWVIAEPTTWDADDSSEFAARVYHGTFPIRLAEVGIARADTMELALIRAIESVERHLPAVAVPAWILAEAHNRGDRAGNRSHGGQSAH